MIGRIFFSAFFLLSASAWAGTVSTIDAILLYEQGMLVYVYPTGGVTNAPACHGSNGQYYSFSMTRPMANQYLDLLTAAHARKATVRFAGEGDCIDQSVSETLRYFRVDD